MSRRSRLFLSVPMWRAFLESWVLGAAGLLGLLLNQAYLEDVVLGQSVFFLMSAVTLWYALRLRMPREKALWTTLLYESRAELALGVLGAGAWWLLIRAVKLHGVFAAIEYVPGGIFAVGVLSLLLFPAARFALHIWVFWLDLRRRHMVWALTHIQLELVLTLAVLFSAISAVAVLLGSRRSLIDLDTWVRTILPLAGIAGISSIFAIIGVLPPAALIAWLTARKTTRRLEDLTRATAALREGDTSTRILVDGEDEVAQLQEDFNAMAVSLGEAMVALQAERDKVAGLLDARRQMIAGVSHELRTPLATLRGYLESIQQTPQAEELEHDFTVMDHELTRLQTLIDDLFTLSRAEVDGLTLDCGPVELRSVIMRRIDAVAPLAWQRDRVRVLAEIPDGLPPAYADVNRIEQILINLIRNALRHTPPGGIVVVTVAETTDALRVSVCDTGEGIPPDELPSVWERFYRGDRARARDAQGAGLGLALVKELTEAMGGRVGVESSLSSGACFHVWLPVSR